MTAEESIKRHEGYSETPYRDTLGIWTCGWGTNIHRMPVHRCYNTLGELLDWLTAQDTHEN